MLEQLCGEDSLEYYGYRIVIDYSRQEVTCIADLRATYVFLYFGSWVTSMQDCLCLPCKADDDSSSTALMVDTVVEMIKEGSEDIEVDADGLLEAGGAPAEVQEEQADGADDSDSNNTDILKGEEEATVVEDINDLIDEYGYYPEEVPINKKQKKKATVKERAVKPDPPIDPEDEWYYADVEREKRALAEILETAGYGTMADQFKKGVTEYGKCTWCVH